MIGARVCVAAFALLAAACGAPSGDPADPAAYRVRLRIVPAAGAPVQRVALPAEAIAALQRPDRGDLRVFDGRGRAVPIARIEVPEVATRRREVRLEALPIMGAADRVTMKGVSLAIEDGRARVVGMDGTIDARDGRAVLGALIDSRRIVASVSAIRIEAEVPANQPVTFTIEAGDDLRRWTPLGETAIYRTEAATLEAGRLALDGADLKRRYLRIGWRAASRLIGPVIVRGVVLETEAAVTDGTPTIATTPPTRVDAHEVRFALPFAARVTGLRIVPPAGSVVIPIRVSARSDRAAPWAEVAAGTLYRVGGGAAARMLRLDGTPYREFRIVADARSAGFSAAPALAVRFAPVVLVAALDGLPPFTLAAGLATAPDVALDLPDLLLDYRAGMEAALATARVEGTGARLMLAGDAGERPARKTVLLWGLLLLGTALLGGMVWVLARKAGEASRPAD